MNSVNNDKDDGPSELNYLNPIKKEFNIVNHILETSDASFSDKPLASLLNTVETNISPKTMSLKKLNDLSSRVERVLGEEFPKKVFIDVDIDGKVFSVNRLKFLYSSEMVRMMLNGAFKEKGSSTITLDKEYESSFAEVARYITDRDPSVFSILDLEELLAVYKCCSQLLMDDKTKIDVIACINRKVADLTVNYCNDNQIELGVQLQEQLSDNAITILSDLVFQNETGSVDLRSINNIDGDFLSLVLKILSKATRLYLSYSEELAQNEWTLLKGSAEINDLHLDFHNISFISPDFLTAIEKIATNANNKHSSYKVHIENAGKLDVESLQLIHEAFSEKISTWDLSKSKITTEEFRSIIKGCQQLETLKLDYCQKLTGQNYLDGISVECPQLKELSLFRTSVFSEKSLSDLIKSVQSIESLNLGWHHYLGNSLFEGIGSKLKKLRYINLTNLNKITDVAMQILVSSCENLQYLNIDFCKKLTGHSLELLSTGSLNEISIEHTFNRRNPLAMPSLVKLLKSRTEDFELSVNNSSDYKDEIQAIQAKYPLVKVYFNPID